MHDSRTENTKEAHAAFAERTLNDTSWHINNALNNLERAISAIPSGEKRNRVTDLQIMLMDLLIKLQQEAAAK